MRGTLDEVTKSIKQIETIVRDVDACEYVKHARSVRPRANDMV